MKLNYGTDPETFLSTSKVLDYADFIPNDIALVPPAFLIREGKIAPVIDDVKHPILKQTNLGNIIMDGAAFEINLNRPYDDPMEMRSATLEMVKEVEKLAMETGLNLCLFPACNYDYQYYNNPEWLEDEQYFQGSIFGCDPDKNAWETDWRCKVLDASRHPLRYAGAHLHFSGSDALADALRATRILSIFVGNFCILNSPFPDLDMRRAQYYGMAGKFRPQKYKDGSVGVEYRSPSVSWLSFAKDVFAEMMNAAKEAVYVLENFDRLGEEIISKFGEATISNMRDINKDGSAKIIAELGI